MDILVERWGMGGSDYGGEMGNGYVVGIDGE